MLSNEQTIKQSYDNNIQITMKILLKVALNTYKCHVHTSLTDHTPWVNWNNYIRFGVVRLL